MKFKIFILALGLSGLAQASGPKSRSSVQELPAWNRSSRGGIPAATTSIKDGLVRRPVAKLAPKMSEEAYRVIHGLDDPTPAQRPVAKPVTSKQTLAATVTPKLTATKPVIVREDSPVIASGVPSSNSSDLASGLVRSPRQESVVSTPRAGQAVYKESDVKDILQAALRLKREQELQSAQQKEAGQSRSNVERKKLTPNQSARLAQERDAALQERDYHDRATQLNNLNVGANSKQDLLRQAREIVDVLDTIPNEAVRNDRKEELLRALTMTEHSIPAHTFVRRAVENQEHLSDMLRSHVQHFIDYLNTLPDQFSKDAALEAQFETMRKRDPKEAGKFVMFLAQLQPKSSTAIVVAGAGQPSELEQFQAEMALDQQDIEEESKKHLDLLARQEDSIKSWNDKLTTYQDRLGSADADKKPRIEALIAKTENELIEMKAAFEEAIQKSSKKLEQHMQEHADAQAKFMEDFKIQGLSRSVTGTQEKVIQDRIAELERQSQEREERLLAKEKALQEKQDELDRRSQDLAAQQEGMSRSSSRLSNDSSGSITRRAGILSRSMMPTRIFYPTYHLPGHDAPVVAAPEAEKKTTWRDVWNAGATALKMGAHKTKEALSKIAQSLPKGSATDEDYHSFGSDSGSDDSSSNSDDRYEVEAVTQRHEEAVHHQEEAAREEEHEPRIDFTGENFTNIG